MVITKVTLENYGTYGGLIELDLVPRSDQQYHKPIVLFSGKNGVGKTTFVEAIRLCLHGSLALGPRAGRVRYREHLLKRIHRSYLTAQAAGGDGQQVTSTDPDEAAVTVEMIHVEAGRPATYRVERRWRRTTTGDVSEELRVLENGRIPVDIPPDQQENFLRELVSPSALELFFFDGEKLKALAKDDLGNTLLGETIRTLLGLDLVQQLRSDLDVYVSRKLKEEAPDHIRVEVERLERELEALVLQRDVSIPERQLKNIQDIQSTKEAIARQEELIAKEGGGYAIQVDRLRQQKGELERELEVQRRRVQEMCSGLLPFAVAPKLCRHVAERLALEIDFKKWKAAEELTKHQGDEMEAVLRRSDFWTEIGLDLDAESRSRLAVRLRGLLERATTVKPISENEVILRVSEPDRVKLAGWIEQALGDIPEQFARATQEYLVVEKELARVKKELGKTPDDLILQPLIETLNTLTAKLDPLQREHDALALELGTVAFKAAQAEGRLRNFRQSLRDQQLNEGRLVLATKTQNALAEYARLLTLEKVALLEKAVVQRFNELSRKGEFISSAQIDPDSFNVELTRSGKPFGRDELSEGEKQLLAIAVIWALRDISGMPLPVIIDTPLGRLDSDHRQSMVQKYFPQASHQVILLATDTEVDQDTMTLLAPAVSHAYGMEFDATLGRTAVEPLELSIGGAAEVAA